MEVKRLKLWQALKKNDDTDKDYDTYIKSYFTTETGVKNFYNWLITHIDPSSDDESYYYNNTLEEFYKKFACDLPWAKKTTYCGGSGGSGNTNTSTWDNFPCVVSLATSKGIQKNKDNSYTIGDFKYYPNGRKGIISTGKISNFTCDDPEFKKHNGGGGGNSSSNENSVSNGIYTTKGDPYQYKIVDCVWYTKGKKITDWKSLKDNQKATDILDGRFPNARKNCNQPNTQRGDTSQSNSTSLTPGVEVPTSLLPTQNGSTSTSGAQQGQTTPDSTDYDIDDINRLVNQVKKDVVNKTGFENKPVKPIPPVEGSLEGLPSVQPESVEINTDILKEEFYSTLKKIS